MAVAIIPAVDPRLAVEAAGVAVVELSWVM
jgi:hypothetical protein